MEFTLNATPKILYGMLTTPSGLSEWFADDVNVKDDLYTFMWDGGDESAMLLHKQKDQSVRFQWEDDKGEDYYFEFLLKLDALTQDLALIVVDFAEDSEKESTINLWGTQVEKLRRVIGG